MLRSCVGNLTHIALSTETKFGQSAFALEFVRWRRKPIDAPMAKSKLNRIVVRKRQSPDEREELKRLHNNYHLQMRSLMQYFREEAMRVAQTTTAEHIVMTPEQEELEYQRCAEENEAWNAKITAEREVRLQKENEEMEETILKRLEMAELRQQELLEKVEATVRREKELAKTFITRDNLDEAIEKALANPVDYNFAIDLDGNIYHGRHASPGDNAGSADSIEKRSSEARN